MEGDYNMALSLFDTVKLWYFQHPDELSKVNLEELPYIISDAFSYVNHHEFYINKYFNCEVKLKDGKLDGEITGRHGSYTLTKNYKNGIAHGFILILRNLEVFLKGNYCNGIEEGLWIVKKSGTYVEKNMFINGKKTTHELYTGDIILRKIEYFENDIRIESYYRNGILHRVISYKKKKKDGLYRVFYITGALQIENIYKDDHEISTRTFYENNTPKTIRNYDEDGNLHGLVSNFSITGNMIFMVNYDHGNRHGILEFYRDNELACRIIYDSGKVKEAYIYEHKKLLSRRKCINTNAIIQFWNPNGKLIKYYLVKDELYIDIFNSNENDETKRISRYNTEILHDIEMIA